MRRFDLASPLVPNPKGESFANRDRLIVILGGKEERHWTEEFLPVGGIVGSDVGENRRLHIRTRLTEPIASHEDARAVGNRFTDLIE